MKKLSLCAMLFFITASVVFARGSFPDIRSPLLQEAVPYLVEKGVISGYPDGKFRPSKNINRAEALKIIFLSKGINPPEGLQENSFKDVEYNAWYFPFIAVALRQNIVTGYPNGTFQPEKTVSHSEFLKMAFLTQGFFDAASSSDEALRQFSDLQASAWYMPYVAFGWNNGFLEKTAMFKPDQGMTRGEAALILYRLMQYEENLPEEKRKKEQELIEKSAVISCETCFNGVDIKKRWPELFNHPWVEVKNGQIFLEGDNRNIYLSDENIILELANLNYRKLIAETSPEEKERIIDTEYADEYQRILAITGGRQGFNYFANRTGNTPIFVRGGGLRDDCKTTTCQLEDYFIYRYNLFAKDIYSRTESAPTFADFIRMRDGKAILFDVLMDNKIRDEKNKKIKALKGN